MTNNSGKIRNSALVDFNHKSLDKDSFVKINSLPAVKKYHTPKLIVDNSRHESELVRNFQKDGLKNGSLINFSQITLYSEPTDGNQTTNNCYVDSISGSDRKRWELSLAKNDQVNDFNESRLVNLIVNTLNRNPILHEEAASKKYVDDTLEEGTILRFNQT